MKPSIVAALVASSVVPAVRPAHATPANFRAPVSTYLRSSYDTYKLDGPNTSHYAVDTLHLGFDLFELGVLHYSGDEERAAPLRFRLGVDAGWDGFPSESKSALRSGLRFSIDTRLTAMFETLRVGHFAILAVGTAGAASASRRNGAQELDRMALAMYGLGVRVSATKWLDLQVGWERILTPAIAEQSGQRLAVQLSVEWQGL